MNAAKVSSAKQAWADVTDLVQRRTILFIAALSLLYKGNVLSRGQVLEKLREAGVTREDLKRYQKWKSGTELA